MPTVLSEVLWYLFIVFSLLESCSQGFVLAKWYELMALGLLLAWEVYHSRNWPKRQRVLTYAGMAMFSLLVVGAIPVSSSITPYLENAKLVCMVSFTIAITVPLFRRQS